MIPGYGSRSPRRGSASHLYPPIRHKSVAHRWSDCVATEGTLFYCAPPYWQTEGYGVDFYLCQYVKMTDLAKSITGKMVISVNDIPAMREAFAGLNMDRVEINYTVGGAGRAKNLTGELIIRNW